MIFWGGWDGCHLQLCRGLGTLGAVLLAKSNSVLSVRVLEQVMVLCGAESAHVGTISKVLCVTGLSLLDALEDIQTRKAAGSRVGLVDGSDLACDGVDVSVFAHGSGYDIIQLPFYCETR